MTFWIVAAVVVALLVLALVWWSSGRSRHRAPGVNADFEKSRGRGNLYDRGTM